MSTEEPSPFEPHLLALSGESKGQKFALEDEFLIGRLEPAVPVNHKSVSRQHCLIRKKDTGFVLEDLGSHNGTFVNGEQVSERILVHGDQILIGAYEFLFVASEEDMPTISADVQFVDQKVDLTQTVTLRTQSSSYMQPEKALAESATNERVRKDLAALLRIATTVNGSDRSGSLQGPLNGVDS